MFCILFLFFFFFIPLEAKKLEDKNNLNRQVDSQLSSKKKTNDQIINSIKWQAESLFSYYHYNKEESFLSGTLLNNFVKLKWQRSSVNIFSKVDILSEKENHQQKIIINRLNVLMQYGSYFFAQQKVKFYFNLDYEYFEDEKSFYFNTGIGAKYNFIKSGNNLIKEFSTSIIFFSPIKFVENVYLAEESFFNNIIYSFRPKLELSLGNKSTLDIICFLKYYQREQNKISSQIQIKPKIFIQKFFSLVASLSFLQYDIINESSRYDINFSFGFKLKSD